MLSLIHLIWIVLAAQAGLLAVWLFHRKQVWPLASLLTLLTLQMLLNLNDSFALLPLPGLRPALALGYGPLILALVRHLGWHERSSLSWWHLVLPAFALIFLNDRDFAPNWFWPFISLNLLAYLTAAFWTLWRFHTLLKQTHAGFEAQSLVWLRNTLLGLTLIGVSDGLRPLLRVLWPSFERPLGVVSYVLALVLVYFLIWRALVQQQAFSGLRPEDLAAVAEPADVTDTQDWTPLAARLDHLMQSAHPYRDPNLHLSALAERLGCSGKQLSALLNRHYRLNFNDFINNARIAEICAFLQDPKRRHDKLLALQLDAGFASKSVFNAAFKRVTGMTPSAWRSQHAAASAEGAEKRPES
jgi:AraC-like DNA-binding protein